MSWIDYSLAKKAINLVNPLIGRVNAVEANVIMMDNTREYSPSSAYEPATKQYVDNMARSGGGNVEITKKYKAIATEGQTEFFYTEPVYQSDSIAIGTVESARLYTVSINDTTIEYTSHSDVQQIDELTDFTADSDTDYIVTINDVDYTYTSDSDATIEEITLGIKDAINAGDEPVTADEDGSKVTISADVAGTGYTVVATAGTYTLNNVQANDTATEANILDELKVAIDDLFADNLDSSIEDSTIVLTSKDIKYVATYEVDDYLVYANISVANDGIKYIPGSTTVVLNNIIINDDEYTATDGNKITLVDSVNEDDVVVLISYGGANVYNKEQIDQKITAIDTSVILDCGLADNRYLPITNTIDAGGA